MPFTQKILDRFWSKVDKKGPIHTAYGKCWTWSSAINNKGYGVFSLRRGRNSYSHRLSWRIHYGKIPDGMCVLHKCDNPRCVNPSHLFLGSHKDNTQDMIRKGRGGYTGVSGDSNPSRTHPECLARGSSHGMAKLSEGQVLEILKLRKVGYTQARLGKMFGVSREQIKNIVNNKQWRHVVCQ